MDEETMAEIVALFLMLDEDGRRLVLAFVRRLLRARGR